MEKDPSSLDSRDLSSFVPSLSQSRSQHRDLGWLRAGIGRGRAPEIDLLQDLWILGAGEVSGRGETPRNRGSGTGMPRICSVGQPHVGNAHMEKLRISQPRLPIPQLPGKILDPLEPLGHSNTLGGAPSSLGNSPAPSPRSGKASGSGVLPGERNSGLNRRLYLHIFIVL